MAGEIGLAEACQTSFEIDKTCPVEACLVFCHLGWRFPVEGDKRTNSTNWGKHRFGMGPDVMCEEAEEEAQEMMKRGGSVTDVNSKLRWLSEDRTFRETMSTATLWTVETSIISIRHVKKTWGRSFVRQKRDDSD